ncbi:hypothetical protein NYO67_3696 [Aspergillus flavus]|nr:hypothetical protein NYO67_3696 [Aspergillus flavus]
MVSLREIRAHNAGLRDAWAGHRHVSLFVGATKGIGLATIMELIQRIDEPTVYIVCRSTAQFALRIAELQRLNRRAKLVALYGQISLLSEVDRICNLVLRKETQLDLLFMSPGYLPNGHPSYTPEGLEELTSLAYYCRLRFTVNLLPLLERTAKTNYPDEPSNRRPRVFSVLNGGNERALPFVPEDLQSEKSYTMLNHVAHTTLMNTLTLEHLAHKKPSVDFVHESPGKVQTDIVASFLQSPERTRSRLVLWRWLKGMLMLVLQAVLLPVFYVVAMPLAESGERRLYEATVDLSQQWQKQLQSPPYNGIVAAPGFYRMKHTSDIVMDDTVLQAYRALGMPERAWEHTMAVFRSVLDKGSGKK